MFAILGRLVLHLAGIARFRAHLLGALGPIRNRHSIYLNELTQVVYKLASETG